MVLVRSSQSSHLFRRVAPSLVSRPSNAHRPFRLCPRRASSARLQLFAPTHLILFLAGSRQPLLPFPQEAVQLPPASISKPTNRRVRGVLRVPGGHLTFVELKLDARVVAREDRSDATEVQGVPMHSFAFRWLVCPEENGEQVLDSRCLYGSVLLGHKYHH